MKRLRKFLIFVLVAVVTLTMAACAAKSAFEFDEDAAIERAKEVIDIVQSQDYEAIFNAFGDDTRKLTTVDGIKASFEPVFEITGAFIEIKSSETLGLIAKDGNKYINVYVKASYEKGTFVNTVSFDTDLNLQGFFTK
ncbi:MAG: DUF3887 domain-containing protein [Clostridiales bacterium]|nr:DUF3887 domain-containing protein [Clostridiales bacterium]